MSDQLRSEACLHGVIIGRCVECDNAALRALLAERDAQLCRARELMLSILIERIDDLPPREWMMRPNDRDTRDWFGEMNHALSSTAPCRHAKEVERLREAVEWAGEHAEDFGKLIHGEYNTVGFKAELRRRAKEER